MKNKSIYISLLGLSLISTSIVGCKKDFLNVEPTDRISTASIETDTAVFEAYVTNRYIASRLQDKEGDGSSPGLQV